MERREGKLTSIAEILDRNIILKGADVLSAKGFTQVPNHVLVSGKLSPGAKLTYAMLLKYAWQNDFCFPGQERLAKDMGVTDRSVRTYLQELEMQKFVNIKQRGLGKPNLYELNLIASAADRKYFPLRTGRK
jgi:Helix-turn-helix domain